MCVCVFVCVCLCLNVEGPSTISSLYISHCLPLCIARGAARIDLTINEAVCHLQLRHTLKLAPGQSGISIPLVLVCVVV